MVSREQARSYLEAIIETEDPSVRAADRLKALELLNDIGPLDSSCPGCAEVRRLSDAELEDGIAREDQRLAELVPYLVPLKTIDGPQYPRFLAQVDNLLVKPEVARQLAARGM